MNNEYDRKIAGTLFTATGMGFLLIVTFLETIYPNYSTHSNTISDLLATTASTSILGEPLLFIVSILWIAGAYYLFRKSGRTKLMIFNLLPGTGLLLAVLSPENVNIVIHSIGAVLAFIPGAIVMLLAYRTIRTPFKYFSLLLGILSLLGIIVEFGFYNTALMQQTLGSGGWERMIIYPIMIWLIGYGNYLLASGKN